MGPAVVADTRRPGIPHRRIPKHLVEQEMARFDEAVRGAAKELSEVAERIRGTAARGESSILEAYMLMVEDRYLRDDVERRVRIDRQSAEWALDCAVEEMASQLGAAHDPYLAERSHDLRFVRERLLLGLSTHRRTTTIPHMDAESILIAHDLSPAETAGLSKDRVKAIVTEVGTRTSHTAILARALEIPAVVGVNGILSRVGNGDMLLVDGLRGRVTLCPTDEMISLATLRAERHEAYTRGLRERRDRPPVTKCGTPVHLRANIELPAEAQIAVQVGAQGIGLYRTEFLYVDRHEPPSEDEQYETFKRVIETVAPLPVTLRTFDIGGDKFVSAFQVPPEMNPALGLRAVRLGLARPALFMAQLRAMVRASAHGPLRIMIPMVSSVRELRAVRELLDQATRAIDNEGHRRAAHIPLGIMVEVPSAAIMAHELAREAEFLSIGTNDLVQYSLAVDRSSRELAYLASPFDPAILRLIQNVVRAGEVHHRNVGVCGAMANDPLAAALLVGMGLRELSMEASAVPVVKEAIKRITVSEAEQVARAVLAEVTAEDVQQIVQAAFAPRFTDLLNTDG
jgi:phosphotransferase system enzyme I (PtsI)